MPVYRCPVCGSLSMAWDARAGAFLCLAPTCRAAFRPAPGSRTESGEDLVTALSRGHAVILQSWLDQCHKERQAAHG